MCDTLFYCTRPEKDHLNVTSLAFAHACSRWLYERYNIRPIINSYLVVESLGDQTWSMILENKERILDLKTILRAQYEKAYERVIEEIMDYSNHTKFGISQRCAVFYCKNGMKAYITPAKNN